MKVAHARLTSEEPWDSGGPTGLRMRGCTEGQGLSMAGGRVPVRERWAGQVMAQALQGFCAHSCRARLYPAGSRMFCDKIVCLERSIWPQCAGWFGGGGQGVEGLGNHLEATEHTSHCKYLTFKLHYGLNKPAILVSEQNKNSKTKFTWLFML